MNEKREQTQRIMKKQILQKRIFFPLDCNWNKNFIISHLSTIVQWKGARIYRQEEKKNKKFYNDEN